MRRFAAGLSLLTLASGAHKAAMFVMKARLGQLGGAELLGAVTAVLTTTWIVTALCHLGLPDLAMVRSALETTERTRAQARHGLDLGTVLVAAAIALALGLGARPDTPALVVLLVLGAIAQHAAAVTLATLRGLAQPRLEAATLAVAASCLVGVSLVADGPLGVAAGFALAGLVFLVAIGVGTRLVPAL
ncbi:MAG: hypothetical protein K1X94_31745, partial [Sandaracinaceae bacterium]|nr:hypothetical protein [Sandaracinaceae bacterium]